MKYTTKNTNKNTIGNSYKKIIEILLKIQEEL